ncbi:hypothetical protein IWQ60_011982 [Tieghemiomyces parasiticus]|uniref:Exosome complex protein n=1 Tax=Tieghemiomyces parasiticus TaxID=78921 RepID=A0A9W7ZG51_9FUNG|nr:hypothetical protein IWQ60_011982 [Tieghemiomyces parasiticus]
MSMSNPAIDLNDAVVQVTRTIDELNALLKPLLANPLAETLSRLTPDQKAQLEVLLAYSLNTIYWAYLKLSGVQPSAHPVMKELQRIKLYVQKVKEATTASSTEGPALRVDQSAAKRIVKHALSERTK